MARLQLFFALAAVLLLAVVISASATATASAPEAAPSKGDSAPTGAQTAVAKSPISQEEEGTDSEDVETEEDEGGLGAPIPGIVDRPPEQESTTDKKSLLNAKSGASIVGATSMATLVAAVGAIYFVL